MNPMRRMRSFLLATTAIGAATMGVWLTPAPAYAGVHTSTFSVSISSHGEFSGSGAGSTVYIPAFNSDLGTLESVLVFQNLTAKYGGTAQFTNHQYFTSSGSPTNPGYASALATVAAATNLSITGGPSILQGTGVLSVGGAENNVEFSYNKTAPFSFSGASRTPSTGYATYTTGLGDWEIAGGGHLIEILTSGTTPSLPGGLIIAGATSPVTNLTYTITGVYKYSTHSDAVPEPTAGLMLGSGVLALGAVRRRRRKLKA